MVYLSSVLLKSTSQQYFLERKQGIRSQIPIILLSTEDTTATKKDKAPVNIFTTKISAFF